MIARSLSRSRLALRQKFTTAKQITCFRAFASMSTDPTKYKFNHSMYA